MNSRYFQRVPPATLAVLLVIVGAAAFGFSLDRYPGFYIDDAFFAYPALKANMGGSFCYAVSGSAPFGTQFWAYHGPAFPHLLQLLFKIFGFSTALSRLPDFLGAWIAILILVVALKRKGYRYAGLALAILWCGDRSPQEVMYGRMDGLALLSLVCAFLCLRPTNRISTRGLSLLCGFFCGLAILFNPLCVSFLVMSLFLVLYLRSWRDGLWLVLGGALNLLLLLPLWSFKVHDSLVQFFWHVHQLQGTSASRSFAVMISALRWSRYWFLALIVFSVISLAISIRQLLRHGRAMDERRKDFVVASAFALASLYMIFRPSTHPYYLVYFAVWPMLCLVTLTERYWKSTRLLAITMTVIWSSSAAWNLLRVRESILFHSKLGRSFLYGELNTVVPVGGTVIVTPELYSVPLEAGHSHFLLTTWYAEHQDACPQCYVLLKAQEYRDATYIARANLDQRTVLYSGPAFPGAGPLQYPIFLLSPERAPAMLDGK